MQREQTTWKQTQKNLNQKVFIYCLLFAVLFLSNIYLIFGELGLIIIIMIETQQKDIGSKRKACTKYLFIYRTERYLFFFLFCGVFF